MDTVKIPRMRTIKEAMQELRALDSHTAITEYHIRQLALSGVIPRVQAGKKCLINLDTLIEYMQDPTAPKFQPKSSISTPQRMTRIY